MAKPTFERVPDFVPVSLRYAYLSTEILVSLDGEWQPIMQLPELDAGSVIVLTAHNPRSQRLSDSDNQERNDALAAQLAESGHEVRPAEAFDPHSDWSESSFVVDGLSHKAARRLCREYGQFAYFEINADTVIVQGGFSRWSLARPHGHDPLPRHDLTFSQAVDLTSGHKIKDGLKRFRYPGWEHVGRSEERCRTCDTETDLYVLIRREKSGTVVEHLAICCPGCGWHAAADQLGKERLQLLQRWFDYCTALNDNGTDAEERRCYVIDLALPSGPALYVGETGKTVEERFREHKADDKANWAVRDHGTGLNRALMVDLPTFPDQMTSCAYEVYLGKKLQLQGHTVFGAH